MTDYIKADWTIVQEWEIFNENEYTYYDWNYYHIEHPDVYRCYECDKFLHKNLLANDNWAPHNICLRCLEARNIKGYIYCVQCKHVHHKDSICGDLKEIEEIKDNTVSFGESASINTEGASFNAKWECVLNTDYVHTIWQYQCERELPKNIKDVLERFYRNRLSFNHYYYRWDYKIEWDIQYMNLRKFRDILNKHMCMVDDIMSETKWYKLSPYRNYVLRWVTSEWLLERAKYDLMWKLKTWTERPNVFLQNMWVEIDNEDNWMTLHYVLSSDLEHKLLAFQKNNRFGSCQKSENCDSYASWAYDAITNGCNCPILIYKNWNKDPLGRITCRVMYDKEWKEYLLLERLYHDWTLWDNWIRGRIYAQIAHDLKCKWYNVIASNYSAHDSSTYSYLARFGLSANKTVEDLCQPLRQLVNGYGYYCDGWTKVYHSAIDWIDWATDYLDKAYLI